MNSKIKIKIFLPAAAFIAALAADKLIPDKLTVYGTKYWAPLLMAASVVFIIMALASLKYRSILDYLNEKAPLIAAAVFILLLWEIATAKFQLLPLPYFPAPGQVIDAAFTDWKMLLLSAVYSLRLLSLGYFLGAFLGLITGTMIGWSKSMSYWLTPFQRIIGPIPATAWIPIAMTVFPTSFAASVFIITLAVWFPVTVMTGSGIANVRKSYFEVAETLGAGKLYLIFKVALPSALPNIFTGLFMGLGMSFVTLIVAEMLGVKAGLGWYINWAQGWAEYKKVYASLAVMALMFSTIITLLFKVRDRILIWQRGLIKW